MTEKTVTEILRKQFEPALVGKLPRVTCPKCSDRNNRSGKCDEHEKRKCPICQAYVSERHIHIDYVGHADVTARLLEADPEWNWEPAAADEHGLPVFDTDSSGTPVGLWIRLTVGGVTRLGYGSVPSSQPDAVKVLIGDALRNSAMRFGVALDLWAKGDRADPTAENATASGGQASRGQARPDAQNGNGQAVKAEQPPPPASRDEVDEAAQPYAEEASQCRTVKALSEVNARAREARKLSALIRNPATGGTGGLGQYIAWLRHQLEDTDAALKQLTDAAAAAGVDVSELDAKVLEITGTGIEAATAAQLRQAAEGLAKVGSGSMSDFLGGIIKHVREYDASRPRSLQAEPGWSEVGGCRAYLGFRLDGAWESDETDSWGATRGTAIHKYLETIFADVPGFRTEVTTHYRGIPGHADLVLIDDTCVTDWKTTKLVNSRLWQSGPDVLWEKRVQANGYAAGLIDPANCPRMRSSASRCSLSTAPSPTGGAGKRPSTAPSPTGAPTGWTRSARTCSPASTCRKTSPTLLPRMVHVLLPLPRAGRPGCGQTITDPEMVAAVAAYGEATQKVTALGKEKDRLADLIRGLRGTAGEWRISLSKKATRSSSSMRPACAPTTPPGASSRPRFTSRVPLRGST